MEVGRRVAEHAERFARGKGLEDYGDGGFGDVRWNGGDLKERRRSIGDHLPSRKERGVVKGRIWIFDRHNVVAAMADG
jgi:hypothetical protein